MGRIKAAFIFVSPDSDPEVHRATVSTPEVLDLSVVGVRNYDEAARVARELADQGFTAIELCGGFGNIGLGKVAEAVGKRACVGAVRFDRHPAMDNKTGDEFFVS